MPSNGYKDMRDSRGFTLIELLLVVAIIGIIAAIATPNLLAARISGNEASAVGSLRAITTAQTDYTSLNRGYADDLATLAAACPGMPVAFISSEFTANGITKSGFVFTLAPGLGAVAGPNDCNGTGTQTTYYATALPSFVGVTGNRGFATNPAMSIWQDTSGAAPAEPFAIAGTVSVIGQ